MNLSHLKKILILLNCSTYFQSGLDAIRASTKHFVDLVVL